METVLEKKVWTEEELLAIEHPGYKCELVNGEIVMSPVFLLHDIICMRIAEALGAFVRKAKRGFIVGSNAGFWMTNRNLRCPDVSFVSKERAISESILPRSAQPCR
jgi:Uma2 family endonuclease